MLEVKSTAGKYQTIAHLVLLQAILDQAGRHDPIFFAEAPGIIGRAVES
jgi:hypothetical protein